MTQEPTAYKGPGTQPHEYSPDIMAMGDCRVCGHTYDAHRSAPALTAGEALEPCPCNYSGGPEGCGLCNETGTRRAPVSVAAEGEAVAWASEWQGIGGLSQALHANRHAAADNAKWMAGRFFPLFAHPARMPTREEVAQAIETILFRRVISKTMDGYTHAASFEAADALIALFTDTRGA